MTQVQGHHDLSGNRVSRTRCHADIAHGRAAPRRKLARKLEGPFDDGTGGAPRIATVLHWGWARMTGDAFEDHVQPLESLDPGHDTNIRVGLLEYWALFN